MKTHWLCIITTAICFGGWPLLARAAGKTGTIGTLTMAAMALVPIYAVLLYQGFTLPSSRTFMILFGAGVLMGTGFIAYNMAISNRSVDVSITVPLISSLMIIVTTSGGRLFFSEALTSQRILGIIFVIAGIILLRPPSTQQPGTALQPTPAASHAAP